MYQSTHLERHFAFFLCESLRLCVFALRTR